MAKHTDDASYITAGILVLIVILAISGLLLEDSTYAVQGHSYLQTMSHEFADVFCDNHLCYPSEGHP